MARSDSRRFPLVTATLALVVLLTASLANAVEPTATDAEATAMPADAPSYTNPVGDDAAENFADPTIIRGRDGYWYAYATADPRFAGDSYRKLKISRSKDMVNWEYAGEVFNDETEPKYDGYGDAARRMYWAPDIEYFGGRYVLYYSYVVNVGADRHWRAIGVATAPTPAGPWTDSGAYVTGPETWEPRPGVEAWRNVIDPEVMATPDGKRYLYYGSVLGGVRVVELSADGLTAVGERTQITPEHRYEAAHIVHRDGYYYLFLSTIGGCCAGPVSAYPVHVARSKDPRGPFLNRDGVSVLPQDGGGTPVQVPNGNRWLSVGHNSVATDLSGQQWMVSHGIDRFKPYLQGRANARHLVISRLDWVDGWPTTNGGQGLLDGPERAPSMDSWVADSFESVDIPGDDWVNADGWSVASEEAGGYLHGAGAIQAAVEMRGNVRVRGAVRLADGDGGSAGLALRSVGTDQRVAVAIDRAAGALVVDIRRGDGQVASRTVSLPGNFAYDDWHELDVDRRGRKLHVELTEAGLDDPIAIASLTVPDARGETRLELTADRTEASFDDITAARLFTPVEKKVADPQAGEPLPNLAEEFTAEPGAEWQWLRTPAASVVDGQLQFEVEQTDLIDPRPNADDSASVLLRDLPDGEWMAETKVTVPFGDSVPFGWPQAGFVAYAGDDEFVHLTYGAHDRSRLVVFGKETAWEGAPVYGSAQVGPTSDTMWLRLMHTVDQETGEHHYRAATSTDGKEWLWHGVRTLPADTEPQLGLAAFGIENNDSVAGGPATFDYVRFSTVVATSAD